MEIIRDIWAIDIVRFVIYLILAFVVAGIAKFIVTRLLRLVRLDRLLDKWGVNEGQVGTSTSLVGKLVYVLVFLLFLPSALGALGLHEVSQPLTGMVSQFVSYIPNIVAAGIIIYVGIFVAVIIGQIISALLRRTKIDDLIKRKDEEKSVVLLSDIIVKIVSAVIILVTVVQALTVLNIRAISEPALGIINTIFGAIPSIILAAVVISGGLLVTSIACGLLNNVLIAVNFDGIVKKIIPQMKNSSTKTVVNIVRALIILFVVAQGVEVLGLTIFTTIVTAIVAYLPMVFKSAVIALAAFVGASMVEGLINKNSEKMAGLAKIVKVAIYVVAGFMILSQLELASTIVNIAFIATLAALAVAFALAFGLGGRDFAKKTLDKVDEKMENNNTQNS